MWCLVRLFTSFKPGCTSTISPRDFNWLSNISIWVVILSKHYRILFLHLFRLPISFSHFQILSLDGDILLILLNLFLAIPMFFVVVFFLISVSFLPLFVIKYQKIRETRYLFKDLSIYYDVHCCSPIFNANNNCFSFTKTILRMFISFRRHNNTSCRHDKPGYYSHESSGAVFSVKPPRALDVGPDSDVYRRRAMQLCDEWWERSCGY